MISSTVIPSEAEKANVLKMLKLPLIICGISWVLGFFTSALNQGIITNLYKTAIHGYIERLLLNLPNLQFIQQYLIENDNILRWERVVSFYALHILLIPLIALFIFRLAVFTPCALQRLWINGSYTDPNKDVRTVWLTPAIFLMSMIMPFITRFVIIDLFVMDAHDKAGIIQPCSGRRCFLDPLFSSNLIHVSDSGFFTVGFNIATSCFMVLGCWVIFAYYAVLARRFYDNLQAKKQPQSTPPQS